MAIPIIDERIKHVGPATLRKMDALKLRGLREVMVIQDGDEPLAVLIPYYMYLEMQKEAAEGQAAIASAAPTLMPGVDKLFMREGPVDALSAINPSDYGKMPAELPVNVDDGCQQPNGGTNSNPDMAHSTDSYREPNCPKDFVIPSGAAAVTGQKDVPYVPQTYNSRGESTERRQVRRSGSTIDMSPIDQIHEKDSEFLPPDTPRCDHCGKEGPDRVCGECFMAGHRAVANCQQCAEEQST
jgi:hypothetical protein